MCVHPRRVLCIHVENCIGLCACGRIIRENLMNHKCVGGSFDVFNFFEFATPGVWAEFVNSLDTCGAIVAIRYIMGPEENKVMHSDKHRFLLEVFVMKAS